MPKVLRPIRKVLFTQSVLRQASIREKKGPSLGKIQVKNPHQRSPHAMKIEDRFHEETERQQRCARGKAWNLAKNIYKLKQKDKATFYSPAEEWVFPVVETKEPEEREFVADSGASMHVVSKKDLHSAELETMRTSRSPTTVIRANGEVQTRTSGQKRHLTKKGKRIDCNISDCVPFVVPGLSTSSSATPTPTSSSSSSQDSVFDTSRYTENPVPERSGSSSEEVR